MATDQISGMIDFPSCARLTDPAEKFPVIEIDHPACQARVALHGAQIMEWTPTGSQPTLYLSPKSALSEGIAIRGGIPICWPWFGPHPEDSTKPAHGFARTKTWQLIACEDHGASVELRFELRSDATTRALWNHEFLLIAEMRLGSELQLSLTSHNPGTTPFTETASLHTYLAVTDIETIKITGLDGTNFIEKAGGQIQPGHQAGAIQIVGELDRVYSSCGDVVLHDKNRVVHVHKHGSASTVIWNPGREKAASMKDLPLGGFSHFVCIETANALEAAVTLAPGETRVMRTRIHLTD